MDIEPHWAWLAAGLLLATAEVVAPGFFLIWLAVAALLTGLVALVLPLALWAQVALFVELALVAVLIARRWLRDRPGPEGDPLLNDPRARLIGQTVVVTQAIEGGSGRVRCGDGEWPAQGADAPAGTRLRVAGHEGLVLQVEPLD